MVFRVLDATAFYTGIPFRSTDTYYTTSSIFNEIKHIKKDYSVLNILIQKKRIIIIEPDLLATQIVIKKAIETGDIKKLSKNDITIIALCVYLKNSELITDDFSIINISKNLGIHTIAIMTYGIKKIKKWVYYCPGCQKECIDNNINSCCICGNKFKRRSFKRKIRSIPINY